jgi:uncharacterized protein
MSAPTSSARATAPVDTLAALDPALLEHTLEATSHGVLERLLSPAQCAELISLYPTGRFRSTIVMARHGFGRGEYRYFDTPLPPLIETLRGALYAALAPIANRWCEALRLEVRYPAHLEEFLARCHAAGQTRPTPLLLRYGPGDYNCLHQDLYGAHAFPLQLTVLLSRPGRDFSGGEFVLTEQRPRRQSRVHVVPLQQGDAVVFPVQHRPVPSVRGAARATLRHGVSRVSSGERYTAGIIFHDAR